MSILITGGNGFLGSYLKDELLLEATPFWAPTSREMDIGSSASIDEYIAGKNIKTIVHLAAEADHKAETSLHTNIVGTYNLINAGLRSSIERFIFASTNNVYGPGNGIYSEEDTTNPTSLYGVSKIIGESLVKTSYQKQCAILRFSDIYGYKQKHGNLMRKFIQNAIERKSNQIQGSGGRVRDYLYVVDAVRAINHIYKKCLTGVYNVSTGIGTNTVELSDVISKVFDNNQAASFVHSDFEDLSSVILDNSKLISENFEIMYNLETGLADMKRRMQIG